MLLDARVPVVVGEGVMVPGDVLFVVPAELAAHPGSCTCCGPQGATATALAALFHARARGEVGWFTRVVAVCRDDAARARLAITLADASFVSGRFRPAL